MSIWVFMSHINTAVHEMAVCAHGAHFQRFLWHLAWLSACGMFIWLNEKLHRNKLRYHGVGQDGWWLCNVHDSDTGDQRLSSDGGKNLGSKSTLVKDWKTFYPFLKSSQNLKYKFTLVKVRRRVRFWLNVKKSACERVMNLEVVLSVTKKWRIQAHVHKPCLWNFVTFSWLFHCHLSSKELLLHAVIGLEENVI